MVSTNQFRTGMVIKLGGELYSIVEYNFYKPGKGGAFVRTKLKNLRLKTITDKTFQSGEKVEDVFMEKRKLQYLYRDGDSYCFMDNESFEQSHVSKDILGDAVYYLKENMDIGIYYCEGNMIDVDLPSSVALKIAHTEPGIRGDTAKGGTKPAELETGKIVQVPLFINADDTINVDTRSGEYLGRA
ncbi:MAG: elongation factor P [Candidatus Omnitrophica bacterium]|nr:elongation factor P [Candidatus Omnitrophota bacterium]